MINYGRNDVPEIDYGQNDEPVAGTALRNPAAEEQQIKDTLDISEQDEIPIPVVFGNINAARRSNETRKKAEAKVKQYPFMAAGMGGYAPWITKELAQEMTIPLHPVQTLKEIGKAIPRFLETGVARFVGGTMPDWIGQFIEQGGIAVDKISKFGMKNPDQVYNPLANSIMAIGQEISSRGKEARTLWIEAGATGWEALDEKLKETDPISYGAGQLTEGVASSALSVLAMYLSGGTGAVTTLADKGFKINRGLVFLSSLSAAGGFEHAQAQGENFTWSTLHGLADGTIEYAMESSFLEGVGKGSSALTAGFKEGGEEWVTGMLQNTRAGVLENEKKGMSAYEGAKDAVIKSLKQSPWEVAAGFIGGWGMVGGANLVNLTKKANSMPIVKAETPAPAVGKAPSVPVAGQTAEIGAVEPVVTGQPYTATLYRGTSTEGPLDQGIYGKARYYAPDKATAEHYRRGEGKLIEEDVALQNPFVGTEADFAKLQPTNEEITRLVEQGSSQEQYDDYAARKITEQLKSRGHDGFVLVDEKGNVLEVGVYSPVAETGAIEPGAEAKTYYHGTTATNLDVTGFKPTESKRTVMGGLGIESRTSPVFFVTEDKGTAEFFAKNRSDYQGKPPQIYNVEFVPQNTLDLTGKIKTQKIFDIFEKAGVNLYEHFGFKNNDLVNPKVPSNAKFTASDLWEFLDKPEFVDALKSQGYDSVLIQEHKSKSLGILTPEKAKISKPAPAEAQQAEQQAWEKESKVLANKLTEEIQQNEIYQVGFEGQTENESKYSSTAQRGLIFVPENLWGEAKAAIANHPALKFKLTKNPKGAKSYDEILMEIGEPDMDISELLDRIGESAEGLKRKGKLNKASLDFMLGSHDADAVILASKYEFLKDGLTPEEINDNIRKIASEWPDIPEEVIRSYFVETTDVKTKRGITETGTREAQTPEREAREKRVQKDLLGRPILEGGASGKQNKFLSKEDYRLREPDIEGQQVIPMQEAPAKGEGEKAEGKARDILGGVEPIQQINKALKEAREKRPLLEAERKTELKRRVAAAAGFVKGKLGKGEFGEKTGQISTGLLKGELSNQRYESIREKMEESIPGAVRNAVASIWNADYSYFDALDIDTAFQKLLDGIPITLRQADLIAKHFGAEMGEIAKTRAEVSSLADRLWTLWRAGLLTGLKSWGPASINTLSNLAHGVTEVGKDYIGAPAEIVASWFTGKREVGLTVKGIPSGMKEGAQKGWDYLKTGIEERPIAEKFDLPRDRINFGETKRGKLQQVYVDTIFHIYGAEDQPFFYGAMAHSIRSQAIASGRTMKLKGADLAKHIDDLVQKPTDDMLENAVADAEQAVFQNKTMLGDIAHAMQKIPVVRWFVPFSRTPSAVAMQIVNYTPVGMVKEIVEEIHNGKFNQRKFVQAFGRAGVGTGALFVGKLLFAAGLITLGYPKNERERKLWELEGRKENSIKVGDKWRSVYTLGPVGNVLLIGGYFQQALDESGSPSEAIVTAMAGGAKSLTEQTFVTGMSQAIDAIKDPERSFDRFFSSMAGSVVPTIVADFAKATDEIERKSTGPWERIVSRLPGARQTLEPRVDVFGQDLPRYGGNPLEVMLDATRPSKIRQDVVVDEIRRLWDKDVRVAPTELGNRDGYKILTPEENTVLWRRSGQLTYRGLFDLIQQPYYKTLSDEAKGKQIEREVKKSKDLARAEVAKIKLNQGNTMEELREDGLVIQDVEKLISQFEISRK